MALLLAFQMTGTSQTPENSTSVNHAANVSLAFASLANANPAKASTIPLQLEGIWSFNLVGRGPVTAVLHQQGEVITGSAKSDGKSMESSPGMLYCRGLFPPTNWC